MPERAGALHRDRRRRAIPGFLRCRHRGNRNHHLVHAKRCGATPLRSPLASPPSRRWSPRTRSGLAHRSVEQGASGCRYRNRSVGRPASRSGPCDAVRFECALSGHTTGTSGWGNRPTWISGTAPRAIPDIGSYVVCAAVSDASSSLRPSWPEPSLRSSSLRPSWPEPSSRSSSLQPSWPEPSSRLSWRRAWPRKGR